MEHNTLICREKRKWRGQEKQRCKSTDFPASEGVRSPHRQARLTSLSSAPGRRQRQDLGAPRCVTLGILISALCPPVEPDFRSLQTTQASSEDQKGRRTIQRPKSIRQEKSAPKSRAACSPRGLLGVRMKRRNEEGEEGRLVAALPPARNTPAQPYLVLFIQASQFLGRA